MEKKSTTLGHTFALITAIIWGTTFISTKVLLRSFAPLEILFLRFLIGFIALILMYPKPLKIKSIKEEGYYLAAGLCGVTFYFLCENIALTYTQASNVGVIVAIAPLFTAILSHFFLKAEKITGTFLIGLLTALAGIVLISFNGARLSLNPKGDLLAIGAAIVWSFYSLLTKKISTFGYHTIQTTRRIFLYGLIFMVPFMFFLEFNLDLARLSSPLNLLNFLFLGLLASATCYVTWNFAIKILGPVKTSIYIYLVPVVTVITSVLILHEKITLLSGLGTLLTLCGLVLSERKAKPHEKP